MDSGVDKAKLGIFMVIMIVVGIVVLLLFVGINFDWCEDEYVVRYE